MNAGHATSPDWPWPDSLDALIAAPNHHRLLFENERVRVLDVLIQPGDFVPVHTHKWPGVTYVQSASDFIRRDGEGKVIFDSRAAGVPLIAPVVQCLPPLPPHSVENIGAADIHLVSVELKEPHAG